jgi:hypothetical protein
MQKYPVRLIFIEMNKVIIFVMRVPVFERHSG